MQLVWDNKCRFYARGVALFVREEFLIPVHGGYICVSNIGVSGETESQNKEKIQAILH